MTEKNIKLVNYQKEISSKFKKNLVLWAGRYEDEFFGTSPETQIDIESGGEEEEIDLGGDDDMGFGA